VTEGVDTLAHDPSPHGVAVAGTLLRAGREAAGLSVAAVAQQLKLAPRQIAAIEDGDYTKLPGRTFVRGFVRNYARLLRLDSDAVLAALPETAAPQSPDFPSLAPTPRPIGELPADVPGKPSPARWAIPLALVAVVSVAAVYEIARPPAEISKPIAIDKPIVAPAMAPVTEGTLAPAVISTATPLPNPLAGTDEKSDAARDNTKRDSADAAMPATASAASVNTSLALSFQGRSWVEVRDGSGAPVLQVTGSAGGSEAVSGRAPFDVILGNANAVTVTWQGKTFDTAPYTRQNVARFTLR
jgi:cytoskeleton protein RodZ